MAEELDTNPEEQLSQQRSTILRIYNYYRLLISFLFLFLFLDPNLNEFVGQVNSELFQTTILIYIGGNIVISLMTLLLDVRLLSKTTPSLIILILDIFALMFLMSASGGVSSGLGNFLIFTLAFGGGLIHGRVSTVLPAIAFILTIYNEFYLFFLDENDLQAFFQAGILGIVYFVANILFQTLSKQIQVRRAEVFTLEQINRMIVDRMRTGVVLVSNDETPKLMNQAAENLLADPGRLTSPRDQLPTTLINAVRSWKENSVDRDPLFRARDMGPELVASFSELQTPTLESDTLIFIEDSTEVQRQAQQLKLASLGRLSASIAHEIRNPLGAISHAAQLLGESDNLDKGDQRLTEIIQNHSVRMNDVIENVLMMSRRKHAEPRNMDLKEYVEGFLADFLAGDSEARIQVDIADGIDFEADPLQMSQVFANLCQNGLRYSKKQTGEARLSLVGSVDTLTGQPYLDVIDFGPGIDEEHLQNLFEPFYTTETSGTGLGLYLSRELCEANDARVNYTRTDAGGSCFRVTFQGQELSRHG